MKFPNCVKQEEKRKHNLNQTFVGASIVKNMSNNIRQANKYHINFA